jgi:hypothetical protein
MKTCGVKNAPRRGCHCFRCDYRRSYMRTWGKDQTRLRTPYRLSKNLWWREHYRKHRRERIDASMRRYRENQLAYLIYFQLLRLMESDAKASGSSSPSAGCGEVGEFRVRTGRGVLLPEYGTPPNMKGA